MWTLLLVTVGVLPGVLLAFGFQSLSFSRGSVLSACACTQTLGWACVSTRNSVNKTYTHVPFTLTAGSLSLSTRGIKLAPP